MKRHVAYLKYVLRHKWFVLIASKRTGCSLWRALLHDMSKFRPSEFFSYAYTFYDKNGRSCVAITDRFNIAWKHHQNRNPHHWEYWVSEHSPLEMPHKYVREMVSDWMGAGRAKTGRWDINEWYEENKDSMVLHLATRLYVKAVLDSAS